MLLKTSFLLTSFSSFHFFFPIVMSRVLKYGVKLIDSQWFLASSPSFSHHMVGGGWLVVVGFQFRQAITTIRIRGRDQVERETDETGRNSTRKRGRRGKVGKYVFVSIHKKECQGRRRVAPLRFSLFLPLSLSTSSGLGFHSFDSLNKSLETSNERMERAGWLRCSFLSLFLANFHQNFEWRSKRAERERTKQEGEIEDETRGERERTKQERG